MTTPTQPATPDRVEIRAIDIVPYEAAIWCSIADGKPFANPIVARRWSEDGEHIWFMLDSHNFDKRRPYELMLVVPKARGDYAPQRKQTDQYDNELFLANRPRPKPACEHCAGTGVAK